MFNIFIYMNCKISIYLAYAASAYIATCLYYYIRTRFVGTPFMDSLTPKQRMIKKKSANIRRTIFYEGIGISILALVLLQPFKKCN